MKGLRRRLVPFTATATTLSQGCIGMKASGIARLAAKLAWDFGDHSPSVHYVFEGAMKVEVQRGRLDLRGRPFRGLGRLVPGGME